MNGNRSKSGLDLESKIKGMHSNLCSDPFNA